MHTDVETHTHTIYLCFWFCVWLYKISWENSKEWKIYYRKKVEFISYYRKLFMILIQPTTQHAHYFLWDTGSLFYVFLTTVFLVEGY